MTGIGVSAEIVFLCMLIKFSFVDQTELNELRTTIFSLLENSDIYKNVMSLSFAQCTYLLSVYKLETLR